MNKQMRADFEQAVGESFADHLCPPLPFDDASAHECYEVIRETVGPEVNSRHLEKLNDAKIETLASSFGSYFECKPPKPHQIKKAIASLLFRWPPSNFE